MESLPHLPTPSALRVFKPHFGWSNNFHGTFFQWKIGFSTKQRFSQKVAAFLRNLMFCWKSNSPSPILGFFFFGQCLISVVQVGGERIAYLPSDSNPCAPCLNLGPDPVTRTMGSPSILSLRLVPRRISILGQGLSLACYPFVWRHPSTLGALVATAIINSHMLTHFKYSPPPLGWSDHQPHKSSILPLLKRLEAPLC